MTTSRLNAAFLCFLILSAWLCTSASAAERLRVAFEPYPPYEQFVADRAMGMNVDIIREACDRIGVVPEFSVMAWGRALLELREGRMDAISSGYKTLEREVFAIFPKRPLSYERLIVAAPGGSNIAIGSLNDLRRFRIGVVRQHSYGMEFDSMRGLDKDYSQTVKGQLEKMLHGRTDLIIGNKLVLRHMAKNRTPEASIKTVMTFDRAPLYILFSRNAGDEVANIADRFSNALSAMWLDGTIRAIHARYEGGK